MACVVFQAPSLTHKKTFVNFRQAATLSLGTINTWYNNSCIFKKGIMSQCDHLGPALSAMCNGWPYEVANTSLLQGILENQPECMPGFAHLLRTETIFQEDGRCNCLLFCKT